MTAASLLLATTGSAAYFTVKCAVVPAVIALVAAIVGAVSTVVGTVAKVSGPRKPEADRKLKALAKTASAMNKACGRDQEVLCVARARKALRQEADLIELLGGSYASARWLRNQAESRDPDALFAAAMRGLQMIEDLRERRAAA